MNSAFGQADVESAMGQVSIEGELEAIFSVIKSSLMFNNSNRANPQLSDSQNRQRLSQELTNYISLYIMKKDIESGAAFNINVNPTAKASEISGTILNSDNGIQALIQVIYQGISFFNMNLDALISRA